jgi:hypothetical protein
MTGNIIGEEIEGFVGEQISLRQSNQYGGFGAPVPSRTNTQLQYLSNRNAWVKLASSVKISEDKGRKKLTDLKIESPDSFLGTKLAENAILFNTLSSYTNSSSPLNSTRANIAPTPALWNSDFAYGIGGTNYGIQPPPGITGVQVNSLNRGSIRKANVTLKAHNRFQFDVIELLYLRLGYTMMLEWGWDKYLTYESDISNDVVLRDTGNTIIEELWFTTNGTSQIGMINEIEKYRIKYSGNYDGFFGKVSNFTWNFNPDGSYDISIDLITIGDVIESLKVNTSSKIQPAPPSPNSSNSATPVEEANNITKSSYLNTIGYFLYQKTYEITKGFKERNLAVRSTIGDSGTISSSPIDGQNNYLIINPSKAFPGISTIAKGNQSLQFYIRLKEFFAQLETLILPRISTTPGNNANASPQIKFELDSCRISHFPNQISLDPKVCVFKFPLHYGDIPTTTFGGTEGVFNPSLAGSGTSFYLQYLADYLITDGDYTYGDLMNIYVNFEFISGLLLANGGPDQELSLFKFLQDLCNGINNALGGVNKLEPIMKNDYIITIIDQTYSQPSPKDIVNLEVYGYNNENFTSNFVKDIKFVSKITPQLASMISIGATAAGSSTAEIDGTAFSKWSEGLIDRFSEEILEPGGLGTLEEQQAQQSQNQTIESYRTIWGKFPSSGNVTQSRINNVFNTVARTLGAFFTGVPSGGISGGAAAVGVALPNITAASAANSQALDKREKRIIGSPYQTMLNESLTFDQFYPKALAYDNYLAKSGVLTAEQIQDKVSTNYLVWLVNAFGGLTKNYKIPYANNRSTTTLASPYNVDSKNARYLEYNDSFISQGKAAYQNYLNNLNTERFKSINVPSSEVGFIPLSFELVLDGISGIKIYNKLNINTNFLPSNYPEALKFIITKVDHSISNNSWDTSLSTISIPETEPYKFEAIPSPSPSTGNTSGTVPINSAGQNRDEYLASIQPINISRFLVDGDWIAFAMNYMIVREGFTPSASPDYGNLRLGYGTRKLLVSIKANGELVLRDAIEGDTTTQKNALIVLKYEVSTTYKSKVVGNNSYQISEADWNALNKYQRTALISYAYNCGSLNTNIANAIKAKDYTKAADLIQNGPVTGKGKPLELLNGLVRRRAEEAALFRYKP